VQTIENGVSKFKDKDLQDKRPTRVKSRGLKVEGEKSRVKS
jgi:hypothetical protein